MATPYTSIKSDEALAAAAVSGESWAWDALVDRYKGRVYSIPLRAGLSPEDAGSIFQTVFVRLLQHLPAIREPQGLPAWLIATTKRLSWQTLRRRHPEPATEEIAAMIEKAEAWLLHPHRDEALWVDQALVRDAMAQVGDRCRTLLQLLYYDQEEPSYETIGLQMQMPVESIGPTRARCLQKMREILRRMGMG